MIEQQITDKTIEACKELYDQEIDCRLIQVEKTNKEFKGDYTLVVFPIIRYSKKSPEQTAEEIGRYIQSSVDGIDSFEVVKGFLNFSVKISLWLDFFKKNIQDHQFGIKPPADTNPVVVEYSSPNTNKPLHLGHIRNNLLGFSLSRILQANGKRVIKVNLINDRGIHICKSMLAWVKWGNGETPASSGIKGDHFVGKYYVLFDQKHKEEIRELVHRGYTEDDAYTQAHLMKEAKSMLLRWENADEEILTIWRTMNNWAYEGFDITYKRLGVDFDKVNYESEMYLNGRDIVMEGLEREVFYQNHDGSVCVDLTDEGLDEKLLLRSDGTSLYITQDIGTAYARFEEYKPERMIYVVGNEQIYHFEVLKKVLKKLENSWYDKVYHLSYGMVELPHGRMKSREGTVVDADDLMDEMLETARKTTEELGKTNDFDDQEKTELFNTIGMGALKYFILKVDPKKNMLFNPEESIDFNGNTGPFIQYAYARIQSLLRKAEDKPEKLANAVAYNKLELLDVEKELIRQIYDFPAAVKQAGEALNPAIIANHVFELVKTYNHYYQDNPILKRVDEGTSRFRITLSWFTGRVIQTAMFLLGIEVPERM
jgi:arginyl-tRNA synthetase